MSTYMPRLCKVCESGFQPTIGHQKYCSPACRIEAQKADFTCLECGATFRSDRSKERKYCSWACSNKGIAQKRIGAKGRFGNGASIAKYPRSSTCRFCGDVYQQMRQAQVFCGRTCMMRARHEQNRETGEKFGVWSLASKGETECRNCGRPAHHLHHIVPRSKSRIASKNWRLNGMPLCGVCHYGWHNRILTIFRGCLTAQEVEFCTKTAGAVWMDSHYPLPYDVQLQYLDALVKPDRPRADDWQESNLRRIAEHRDLPPDMAASSPGGQAWP